MKCSPHLTWTPKKSKEIMPSSANSRDPCNSRTKSKELWLWISRNNFTRNRSNDIEIKFCSRKNFYLAFFWVENLIETLSNRPFENGNRLFDAIPLVVRFVWFKVRLKTPSRLIENAGQIFNKLTLNQHVQLPLHQTVLILPQNCMYLRRTQKIPIFITSKPLRTSIEVYRK